MAGTEGAALTPDRWRRIEELFHAAREQEPSTRTAFLDSECAEDPVLRAEVDALLEQRDDGLAPDGLTPLVREIISTPPGRLKGRTLGPYVLGSLIGTGGMSEVYRAQDSKLGRDVAIKILPATLAASADRLARFEREARILATLSHPNIATIHGFLDNDGVQALVLELVEGTTLADKLAPSRNSALSLAGALGIARQIAEALEAAHQKGVVHRDLKPANITITSAGIVKVLDFGIAKVEEAIDATSAATPVHRTVEGSVLGTAAYMSPEQARGLPVDKRTDIWAFGCVLYEMLSGVRSFPGDTFADVMGAITTSEPDWSRLPSSTPPRIRDLLLRCLRKDPSRRLHDIADARIEIADALDALEGRRPLERADYQGANRNRRRLLVTGALLVAAALVAAGTSFWQSQTTRTARPTRVSIELPPDISLYAGRGSSVAVSPDGLRIVYVAAVGNKTRLYVRSLDGLQSTPIAGTDGATNPFFSPDGRWIGFWLDGSNNSWIKKVPAGGGDVATVIEQGGGRGAAWDTDDSLLFTRGARDNLIWRAPATGPSNPVTSLAAGANFQSWPDFLPGASGIIYTLWNNTGFEGSRIAVQPLGSNAQPTVIVEGASYGRVVSVGRRAAYLVYAKTEGLFAAPYDVAARKLTGPSFLVQAGVLMNLSGGAHFSFSQNGVMAYIPGGVDEANKTLLWLDRQGNVKQARSIPGLGFQYRLSPDGRRIARPNASGQNRDLYIDDIEGKRAPLRLTYNETVNGPIWTPDGKRVIYTSGNPPLGGLFWRAADGTGEAERLTTSSNQQGAGSVTPDGNTLLYMQVESTGDLSLWMMPLTASREPRVFLNTPSNEGYPNISPDGRWVAYQSNISGRVESYIASFPDAGHRTSVSHGGGYAPIWSHDGRELYYRSERPENGGGQMMAVSIGTIGSEPAIGEPRVLFSGPTQGNGDLDGDGRFLLLRQTTLESSRRVIQLVLNWFDDLQTKVSTQ